MIQPLVAGRKGLLSKLTLLRLLPKILAQAPPGMLHRRLIAPFQQKVTDVPNALRRVLLHTVDRYRGPKVGNALFQHLYGRGVLWHHVDNRLQRLADQTDALKHFVEQIALRSNNPCVIVNLCRSGQTKDLMQAYHLLSAQDADAFFADVADTSSTPRHPAKHRLILASSAVDAASLSLLFSDADAVTVMMDDDLYGRTRFPNAARHAPDCTVNIVHPRNRITRFSAAYHTVHEATRRAAEQLIAKLIAQSDGLITDVTQPYLALGLADYLFFPCLKYAAFKDLLSDPQFDQVIIAVNGDKDDDARFCQMLAPLLNLTTDTPATCVATTPNHKQPAAFQRLLDILKQKSHTPTRNVTNTPTLAQAQQDIAAPINRFLRTLRLDLNTPKPYLLFATIQVAAYNNATAAYLAALKRKFEVEVAFMGGNLLSFAQALDDTVDPATVSAVPQKAITKCPRLIDWLEDFLRTNIDDITDPGIAHLIRHDSRNCAETGIGAPLFHAFLCTRWFGYLKTQNRLPRALVLTPLRSAYVAMFAGIARQFEVPSIALEPHGINANYCRYTKITADYYGVISSFFVQAAIRDFGIDADRCRVIGSPRLQAHPEHDISAAKAAARRTLTQQTAHRFEDTKQVLTFFSQPSDWTHMSKVWASVIAATQGLDCQVLLKLHPEENHNRLAAYCDVVAQMKATHRAHPIEAETGTLITASDLVLSTYSATVIEAALQRRPVFCVTVGDVDYPLNQHDVINAPLLRSTADLHAEISKFMADHSAYHANAGSFLEQEPQFTSGFAPPLIALLNDVIALPPEKALRSTHQLPSTLFLDGPHKVFQV